MNRSRLSCFLAVILPALTAPSLAFADPDPPKPGKQDPVSVKLLADTSAAVPGQTHELAVVINTQDNWHVYWANPGGSTGLPTSVTWKSSFPIEFGQTQYPPPEAKFDKVLKETSWVLPGESTLLAKVRIPTDLSAEQIVIQASVRWLSCREGICVLGSATPSITLPVAKAGTTAQPSNAEVFDDARSAMPVPMAKAEQLKLATRIDGTPKAGASFVAVLTADIKPRHHMQSHTPNQDFLIPAIVFVEQTPGFEIGEVVYPRAHERRDPALGNLSEYSGKVDFRIPVKVEEQDADGKPLTAPRRIRGILQYQICDDKTCFPPMHVFFEVPVQLEGGPAASPGEQFSTAAADPGIANPVPTGAAAADAGTNDAAPVVAPPSARTGWADKLANFEARLKRLGYPGVLILAFLGGLVLNLMPCVLPVISLKVLSFVRQAEEDRGRLLGLGLAYCAGLMTFFVLLAALYVAFNQSWGALFQSPYFTLGLAALVTALSLSLFGVFAIFPPAAVNRLGERVSGEGPASAFLTGVLATVLGSACTAPGLGAALGVAKNYPGLQGGLIFIIAGFGMAFPFLILSFVPAWVRFIPRPGNWMHAFEVVMGFLLLGTVIWLLFPISGQLGEWGLILALMFLLFVGFAMWIKGRARFGDSRARRSGYNLAAAALVAIGWILPFQIISPVEELLADQRAMRDKLAQADLMLLTGGSNDRSGGPIPPEWSGERIPWLHYSELLVESYVNAGYTVFVDFTADWCASCKANLNTSIDVDSIRRIMREFNVIPVEADYTNEDPHIREALQRYQRDGVPLYLVFSPFNADEPKVLPELLTPGIVEDALRSAGSSRPAELGLARQEPAGDQVQTGSVISTAGQVRP